MLLPRLRPPRTKTTDTQYSPPSPAMATASMSCAAGRVTVWPGLDLLQHRDLVAQTRRVLELESARRGLHAPAEIGDHLGVASVEHPDRVGDVPCIVLGRDETDAGRPAAPDLVLQARARAVGEERVLALAHAKQLLQQQQRLAGG